MSSFLQIINKRIKENRPEVPDSLKYTIWADTDSEEFVQVWLRTRGCRHNNVGGCTMCDYWTSGPVGGEEIISYLKEALGNLNFQPKMLLLNTSGSVFDNWEIPRDTLNEIFRLLSSYKGTHFLFETHPYTITEEIISDCRKALKDNKLSVEMGFETSNTWIAKYCINKTLAPSRIVSAVNMLHNYGIETIINILIGAPFLSLNEIADDAVNSIEWAFKNGVTKCVAFPINVKKWTLVNHMEKIGLYTQPSLWLLVEVLSRVKPEVLDFIEISWYKERPKFHPLYDTPDTPPVTCPKCYDKVLQLLDRYVMGDNRKNILDELVSIKCECKDEFYNRLGDLPASPLHERVRYAYRIIGDSIMGQGWWENQKDQEPGFIEEFIK